MKRLPRYDKDTGRSELAAFFALGMAGATLTVVAFLNGMQPASPPSPPSELVPKARTELVAEKTNLLLTNVLFIQQPASSGQGTPSRSLAAPQG